MTAAEEYWERIRAAECEFGEKMDALYAACLKRLAEEEGEAARADQGFTHRIESGTGFGAEAWVTRSGQSERPLRVESGH